MPGFAILAAICLAGLTIQQRQRDHAEQMGIKLDRTGPCWTWQWLDENQVACLKDGKQHGVYVYAPEGSRGYWLAPKCENWPWNRRANGPPAAVPERRIQR